MLVEEKRPQPLVRRGPFAVVASVAVVVAIAASAAFLSQSDRDSSAPTAKRSTPATEPATATEPAEVSTPEPTVEGGTLSPQEMEAWLDKLPVGLPAKLTYHTHRGYVVDGRVEYVRDEEGSLLNPISTPAGVYFTHEPVARDEHLNGWLIQVREDGSARRVGQGDDRPRYLAPDGKTFAMEIHPQPTPGDLGPAQVEVRDVRTGRVLHRVSRDAALVGWSGERVIWTEYGETDDSRDESVWSWLPGGSPKRITTGATTAVAGNLMVLRRKEGCPRLVRIDRPSASVLPHCIAESDGLSPNGRLLFTVDAEIIDVATKRKAALVLPEGLEPGLIGWEDDALIADVFYSYYENIEHEPVEGGGDVRVRCSAETGKCERVAEDTDVRVVQVRVPK